MDIFGYRRFDMLKTPTSRAGPWKVEWGLAAVRRARIYLHLEKEKLSEVGSEVTVNLFVSPALSWEDPVPEIVVP